MFVTEYGAAHGNSMKASLIRAIQALRPGWEIKDAHGLLSAYCGGGMRPSRLLNLVYVFGALPLWAARFCPDAIVSSSAPPMIQVWAALIGSALRSRVIVWLLDYHPEIEARLLDRHGCPWIARLLRWVDRKALDRAHLVVALDDAMVQAVRRQCACVGVVAHPTWNVVSEQFSASGCNRELKDDLRFVHIGNLGKIHDVGLLERLCGELARRGFARLFAIGCSDSGNRRFASMCGNSGCEFLVYPRCADEVLARRVSDFRPHFGIVLMRDEYAGLASPSKFMTYLRLGVSLLYIGPQGTNADIACRQFGAGIALRNAASEAELSETCSVVTDPRRFAEFQAGMQRALVHFDSKNQDSMARVLVDGLESTIR